MSVFGLDIGFLVMVGAVVLIVGGFVFGRYESEYGSNEKLERASYAACLYGIAAVFVVGIVFFGSGAHVTQTEIAKERSWELQETHELVSLATIDASGRLLQGSSSERAWAMLGSGGGFSSGKLSSEPDAGVYLLVERQSDKGLRKLAVNANETVIYEVDDDRNCRAELYRAVVTTTETLVKSSWWFPSAAEKFADGPVKTVREDWPNAQEWRVFLPKGSVVTGSWGAGAGLDGAGAEEEER